MFCEALEPMVCVVDRYEKPALNDPVLIEGLPGIGFVANIAVLHMIRQLKAVRFAEVHSSAFQDLSVVTETGATRSPVNELHYVKNRAGEHDLILWHGNTQALTTLGQYELCGRVLEVAQELGCQFLITLGGFKTDEVKPTPQMFCAATDTDTLSEVLSLGAKTMVGQIFGVAGLLIGLARLKNSRGFALLVETVGTYPDESAAHVALASVSKFLNISLDLSMIGAAVDETKRTLESLGLIRSFTQEKKREEQPFRWSI
jgi:uncharacterized protein (TIGR00162 family)